MIFIDYLGHVVRFGCVKVLTMKAKLPGFEDLSDDKSYSLVEKTWY